MHALIIICVCQSILLIVAGITIACDIHLNHKEQ